MQAFPISYGMKVKMYNLEGKEAGQVLLPDELFGLKWNPDLVHQIVVSETANRRKATARVKDRGQVRGGGRKPWQQKGLGRARHGSIRSPIWKGGGATFGPTAEKSYSKKINKKMKRKALLISLSQKLRDNEILVLDKLEFREGKTKEAFGALQSLSKNKNFVKLQEKGTSKLFLLPRPDPNTERAVRNIPRTRIIEARNLNILDLLNYQYVLLPKGGIKVLKEAFIK